MSSDKDIFVLPNQVCPVCGEKKATYTEYEVDDPFCGTIEIFSVKCDACGYRNSDLEFVNPKEPAEYTLEIESPDDLNIRVVKSSSSEIKIPNLRISVDSGPNSEGYISNVEGVLRRFIQQIEFLKEDPEITKEEKKKLKKILNDLNEVIHGYKKIKLVLVDRTGNSAIISDKVKVRKLKKNKK